jgi:hypothetical protein
VPGRLGMLRTPRVLLFTVSISNDSKEIDIAVFQRLSWEAGDFLALRIGRVRGGEGGRTNGCTSRVHAVAQAACFHELLDGGDFVGDGYCGGTDLEPGV